MYPQKTSTTSAASRKPRNTLNQSEIIQFSIRLPLIKNSTDLKVVSILSMINAMRKLQLFSKGSTLKATTPKNLSIFAGSARRHSILQLAWGGMFPKLITSQEMLRVINKMENRL